MGPRGLLHVAPDSFFCLPDVILVHTQIAVGVDHNFGSFSLAFNSRGGDTLNVEKVSPGAKFLAKPN